MNHPQISQINADLKRLTRELYRDALIFDCWVLLLGIAILLILSGAKKTALLVPACLVVVSLLQTLRWRRFRKNLRKSAQSADAP
jgi:hypothetical protein